MRVTRHFTSSLTTEYPFAETLLPGICENMSQVSGTRRPRTASERDSLLRMKGGFLHGDDSRDDNDTPVLDASLHRAAPSERRRGENSREPAQPVGTQQLPVHTGVEDK